MLRDRRGVAAIEFAVILPVMLMAIMPITDIARVAMARIQATQAMRNLAAYAQLHPPIDVTDLTGWTLPAIPGHTIAANVVCGNVADGTACTDPSQIPKRFVFTTTVKLAPMFPNPYSHITACSMGCLLRHAERFQ